MRLQQFYFLAIAISLMISSPAVSAQQAKPAAHEWGYAGADGPSHWGDLNPNFAPCKVGHRQSPIDIRNAKTADLPPIEFSYKPSPLDIIDNGHTIMIKYAPGSFIRVGGKQYELKQFHFHKPSEEKINGKSYDMVVHMVHADKDGNLAVVAVLLQKGADNQLASELWANLPAEKEKEEVHDDILIDLDQLLPAQKGYYTFDGSLTTPPCSEGVTWFVMKQPVTVSEKGMSQFERVYRDDARPTQPVYDREILQTK